MGEFEEQLRQALRREDPPEGFAERVLARTAGVQDRKSRPRWRWAVAAAATLIIGVSGFQYYQQRQMRIRGERAKEQVVLALQFAGAQLHSAQQKVFELGAAGEDK